MMVPGFRAQTNLFDLDFGLGLTGFAFLFLFLVKELAVIDDLANGRVGVGGDFYQVQASGVGALLCFGNGNDANVFPIFIYKAYALCADAFIYTMFCSITNLLSPLV